MTRTHNRLPNEFYTNPKTAKTCLMADEVERMMKNSGGTIISCGKIWNIIVLDRGCNVCSITLEEQEGNVDHD